jgi:glucosamine--fructose-6-phosphate aminotransferase (isomerizing)
MCGIVAAIAAGNIVPVLIEGLNKLEYRGYDSAGLAVEDSRIIASYAELKGESQAAGYAEKYRNYAKTPYAI